MENSEKKYDKLAISCVCRKNTLFLHPNKQKYNESETICQLGGRKDATH